MRRASLAIALVVLLGCHKDLATAPLTLTLQELGTGAAHSLAQDQGHVVLLDVWATWCGMCRGTLPQYQALLKKYEARGLRVYALSVDSEPKKVAPYLEEAKVQLPVLLDPDSRVADEVLHVRVMPTLFFLDKRGRIRHVEEGLSEDVVEKASARIEALLTEPDA
jgi:thiol-disulfide isomerase/thioredoxin